MPEQFHTFQCKGCGNSIRAKLPDVEDFVFLNHPQISIIGLPHQSPTYCAGCNLSYHPIIAGFQPQIVFVPFEDKKPESRIIVPNAVLPMPPRGNQR